MNRDRVDQGKAIIDRVFDEVAERLEDGRPYLMGEQFTAADLTFASMAAAVLCPAQYGVELPRPEEFPAKGAQLLQSYRSHPAGVFALRMFEQHRRS